MSAPTPWQRASLGELVRMLPGLHSAAAPADETAPFIPEWADERTGSGRHAGPERAECNCQTAGCPDGPRPPADTKHAMLSYAPGVVDRMSRERVRNGQWEDIPACIRLAGLRVHKPAVDNLSRIRADLEHGVLDMHPVFDRTPALHADPELGRELHRLAADLAADLDDMRRRSAAGEKQPWHPVAMRSAA
jgi:hypothetical protein